MCQRGKRNALNLQVSAQSMGRWRVLKVSGDLDMATAGMLRHEIDAVLKDGEEVAVDLGNLTFMDSSGLGVLLAAFKHSATDGGSFAVLSPGPHARRVFEAAGVLELLPIYHQAQDLPGAGS